MGEVERVISDMTEGQRGVLIGMIEESGAFRVSGHDDKSYYHVCPNRGIGPPIGCFEKRSYWPKRSYLPSGYDFSLVNTEKEFPEDYHTPLRDIVSRAVRHEKFVELRRRGRVGALLHRLGLSH